MSESVLQNLIADAVATEDKPFLDTLWKDGLVGGSSGGIVGYLREAAAEAVVSGRRKGPALSRAPAPGEDGPVIAHLNSAVQKTALVQRAPEALRDYFGRVTPGSGTEHLYVSAEAILD